MMLDIMEEIDGTLGRGLERAFVVAFGRVLRDNPFFQKYEWWIVGCVIGLPIIVYWIAMPIIWMAIKEYREKHPSNTKPESEQRIKHRKLLTAVKGALLTAVKDTLHRARVDAPAGLWIPFVMSIIALFIAINANVSYDFFVLLRVLVFVTCIACGTALWKTNQKGTTWFWIMVSIAVIYNPLLPIHLKRETWELINLVTISVFCLLCFLIKSHRDAA
jgi:hypothetical protein